MHTLQEYGSMFKNRAKTERHTSRELCGKSHFAWDNMQK
ncbi:hypothetical protein BIFLH24_00704 [Bifidobacterium breve]|uniref:Uncharacterized protein n=1 Tax=Bifidobacterium breve TaxID=1685 RepID=A0ABD7VQI5_BIFBR|nr:hypothetical protein BIFLH24_00704 [Bifidobacterium breve]VWQ18772.1 hypothetical+protein [Bifidobacterium breve]